MDDDLPLIFTPLVRQAGMAIPDWLFGPAEWHVYPRL